MRYLFKLLLLLISSAGVAQQTGKVDYKYLGLSFVIPDQWIGQESDGGYLMGSNTIPGMILLMPHDRKYTVEELKAMAQQGLNEGNGTFLSLEGATESIGTTGVGGNFTGTLNYEQVRAYLIGVTNEYGKGLTIIALTSPSLFDEKYKNLALEVMSKLEFYKPETGPVVNEWKKFLNNMKLTFMESYSSSSPIGGGGGYSIKREIDLCSEGYFNYRSNSSMSITGSASTAYSHGSNKGNGSWEVLADGSGNAVLRLNYYSGEYTDYPLSYENDKLHLNGERYYRTNDSQCY